MIWHGVERCADGSLIRTNHDMTEWGALCRRFTDKDK